MGLGLPRHRLTAAWGAGRDVTPRRLPQCREGTAGRRGEPRLSPGATLCRTRTPRRTLGGASRRCRWPETPLRLPSRGDMWPGAAAVAPVPAGTVWRAVAPLDRPPCTGGRPSSSSSSCHDIDRDSCGRDAVARAVVGHHWGGTGKTGAARTLPSCCPQPHSGQCRCSPRSEQRNTPSRAGVAGAGRCRLSPAEGRVVTSEASASAQPSVPTPLLLRSPLPTLLFPSFTTLPTHHPPLCPA